jgi:hypothetical protein
MLDEQQAIIDALVEVRARRAEDPSCADRDGPAQDLDVELSPDEQRSAPEWWE